MTFSNQHLTRQADLIPLEILGEPITIIGAGAIGSWTCLGLAKMGFGNLQVLDFDTIELENLNSQIYGRSMVGLPKVFALQKLVEDLTGIRIDAKDSRYGAGNFPGIVISAVDSMPVRKTVWENHAGLSAGTKAIIDPRMGAEQALMYVMNPMNERDQKAYTATLYSEEDSVQERCTNKATFYTANMLSGLVCKAVKDLLTRGDYLRVATWNIKENSFDAQKKGN